VAGPAVVALAKGRSTLGSLPIWRDAVFSVETKGEMGMRALIVYESMFGATRAIAEAIAEGLGSGVEARLIPVAEADANINAGALEGLDPCLEHVPSGHPEGRARPDQQAR
jgi:hypothetical protein